MTTEVVNAGFAVQHLESYFIATPTVTSNSRVQTVSNGTQTDFPIPFPYIDVIDVIVLINGLIAEFPAWSFVNPTLIRLPVPQTAGILIEVRRQTSLNSLVTFTDGAVLTGEDLNLATLQNLYLIQEFNDLYAAGLNGALQKVAGFNGPVTVTPAEMVAAVADQVLSSALATSLQARITDIDLNAQALLDQAIVIDGINSIIDGLTGVGGIGVALLSEATSRIAGDTALQQQLTLIGAFNVGQTAFVFNQATAYVDPTTSLATYITGVTTTLGANTAAITTQASAVAGLSAQYTIKVDVNGHVAGFGLASLPINGAIVSTFIVQANVFSIVDPGNGLTVPTVPFTVSGGVVFMNSVVINGALIANATITNAQIANLTVGTAQLAANAVTNLSVNTSAATVITFGPTLGVVNNATIISETVTTTGGQVEIDAGCMVQIGGAGGASANICNLQIYRDGVVVANSMLYDPTFSGSFSVPRSSLGDTANVSLVAIDNPPAGAHTYTLHVQLQRTSAASVSIQCSNNFIKVLEIKK